jgi:hypothetical protein
MTNVTWTNGRNTKVFRRASKPEKKSKFKRKTRVTRQSSKNPKNYDLENQMRNLPKNLKTNKSNPTTVLFITHT